MTGVGSASSLGCRIFGCVVLLGALLSTASCGYLRDRALDLADCFKGNVGAGLGLAVDAKITDWVSPGVGFASVTANAGWDDRRVYGLWRESDVINTPRGAYEAFFGDYEQVTAEDYDERLWVAGLAFGSLNLPNERWIRVGDRVTVEHYSLFNVAGIGALQHASAMTGHLTDERELVQTVDKTVWQRSFIEVGLTAGLVHARVGWNPLQTVDFLLGWFGLDVAGDDGGMRGAVVVRTALPEELR